MLSYWKECLIVALLLVIAGGVALWPKPVTVTKTQIVTKTISPDGTVTESITNSNVPQVKALPKYRAGVTVNLMNAQKDQRVSVGARLGDLPLFFEVGARPLLREVDVGFSVEF